MNFCCTCNLRGTFFDAILSFYHKSWGGEGAGKDFLGICSLMLYPSSLSDPLQELLVFLLGFRRWCGFLFFGGSKRFHLKLVSFLLWKMWNCPERILRPMLERGISTWAMFGFFFFWWNPGDVNSIVKLVHIIRKVVNWKPKMHDCGIWPKFDPLDLIHVLLFCACSFRVCNFWFSKSNLVHIKKKTQTQKQTTKQTTVLLLMLYFNWTIV